MTVKDIKELKDKIYELEGLLELAQMREEKIDELEPLIKERLQNLVSAPRLVIEKSEPSTDTLFPDVDEPYVPKVKEPIETKETKKAKVYSSKVTEQKKNIFCLNDRFRFRNSLFGGSEDEFADAMKQITLMDDFEEAENYFLGTYDWDAEGEETLAFFEILRNYYGYNS